MLDGIAEHRHALAGQGLRIVQLAAGAPDQDGGGVEVATRLGELGVGGDVTSTDARGDQVASAAAQPFEHLTIGIGDDVLDAQAMFAGEQLDHLVFEAGRPAVAHEVVLRIDARDGAQHAATLDRGQISVIGLRRQHCRVEALHIRVERVA